MFELPLFPEGSLDSSVTTTVWIGVFVSVMFNLRLGWALSGLVVPGYVVPLLITKPWSAAVIFAEGALAYFLVWVFSERLSRYSKWSNFFGRDRFFALILSSIVVRLVLDGYFLPWLGRTLSVHWLSDFDFASNLHSFGLIIIALIANQFWKPGFWRGLIPISVTTGLTFLLVRYPLLEWTNFNIGSLEFMYEDISASVFSSPKAYIILVCTAFLASRLNLRYSWEFNGIMIPSLLALQWYDPLKIMTSFLEAWVIYCAAVVALRLPLLREMTIEGGRKILLFFNISFVYKLAVAHIVSRCWPDVQVTDCLAFGYLLPSLLAMKMHDKGIPERITRTTLQASLVGAAGAGALGFCLTLLPQDWMWTIGEAEAVVAAVPTAAPRPLGEQLREDKVAMYERRISRAADVLPTQRELDAFRSGIHYLRSFASQKRPEDLERCRQSLRSANFQLLWRPGEFFYVRELPPRHGWGLYVVPDGPASGPAVEVPFPLGEWATLESAGYLFQAFDGASLAVSTAARRNNTSIAADVISDPRSFFQAFHKVFGLANALQVRGYTPRGARALHHRRYGDGTTESSEIPSSLWVHRRIPEGVSPRRLRDLVDGLDIEWADPPFRNVQRTASKGGFAEVFLRRNDRKRLLARFFLGDDSNATGSGESAHVVHQDLGDGMTLEQWLLEQKGALAPRGSNLYVPPAQELLLFIDEEILTPLVRLLVATRKGERDEEDIATELRAIHAAAGTFGYEAIRYRGADSDDEFVVFREKEDLVDRRYWGSYVFRLGNFAACAIEIPRAGYERNTLEYGAALFRKMTASAILVTGSHPKCNTDNTADVVHPQNKRSLFNLVNQVLLRETESQPFVVVQVRAFGHKPGALMPDTNALLSFSDGSTNYQQLTPVARNVVQVFWQDGLSFRFVDGSLETTGYEAYGSAQAAYLPHVVNKEFVALWLSPYTRWTYAQDSDGRRKEARYTSLGIETVTASLHEMLAKAEVADLSEARLQELLELVRKYQTTRDMNVLRTIQMRWPEYRLQRVIDTSSQKSVLLITEDSRTVPLIARLSLSRNLFLSALNDDGLVVSTPIREEDVERFMESDYPFLLVGESQ